jgi:PIN domain nuclease of toxin-antitoxin system
MRLLLDTQTLVWWWTDDPRLPAQARAAIANPGNIVFVSAVSGWEITTRHRIGKWPEVDRLIAEYSALLRRSRFQALAISMEHAHRAGALPGMHRDPFDRMLIAQCGLEALPIVTSDAVFAAYGVEVIWDGAVRRSRPPIPDRCLSSAASAMG